MRNMTAGTMIGYASAQPRLPAVRGWFGRIALLT
jgi:hypothetical protein